MARGEDFSIEVKRELASRAGHRCSMPSCRAPTSGPSDTRVGGASNVGVAAHIHAASPGGPRYDSTQTQRERRSIENGLWLCQTDAKRIDDDEVRFPSDLLIRWSELAEDRARRELGRSESGVPVAERGIVPHRRSLTLDRESLRHEVDAFLSDVGGKLAWQEHYELIRMLLFELGLNAVEHGGAHTLVVESSADAVSLEADGEAFSPARLQGEGGGTVAHAHLSEHAAGTFTLRFQELGEGGRWTIVDEVIGGGPNTPCSVAPASPREFSDLATVARLKELDGCEQIHVYPGQLWSYSDWFMFLRMATAELQGVPLILHGLGRGSPIADHIEENFEGVSISD